MFLAAAAMFLAGAVFEPLTIVAALYVLTLLAYMVVDAALLPRRRQISIRRHVPERISLASPTLIRLEVHNGSRRRVLVRLAEDLPEGIEARPAEVSTVLGPGQRTTLEYRLVARRRGRHELVGADVRVLPAMGLFYRQFRLKDSAELHVFPNLVNIRKYELLARRGLAQEQGIGRLRQIGQGSEFESLRMYAPGDDLGRVDWKATAKRARLVVRNYQPERRQSVLVAIDVGRATAGEFKGISRLDYLIDAALMLAYVTLRQGDWFSLLAFSDRIESYLPPVRRLESIDRVARGLYELQPRLVESDYGWACQFLALKNRKRSLICLMTDVIDRQASDAVLAYLARFAQRHLPLAVTLANPEIWAVAQRPLSESADPYPKAVAIDVLTARAEALQAMRSHGVDVLDVYPTALTAELIGRYLLIKSTRRL